MSRRASLVIFSSLLIVICVLIAPLISGTAGKEGDGRTVRVFQTEICKVLCRELRGLVHHEGQYCNCDHQDDDDDDDDVK